MTNMSSFCFDDIVGIFNVHIFSIVLPEILLTHLERKFLQQSSANLCQIMSNYWTCNVLANICHKVSIFESFAICTNKKEEIDII